MIGADNSITLLTVSPLILLVVGIIVCAWGKYFPGRGSWFVWASLLLIFTGVGLDSGLFLNEDFRIKIWSSGWVLAKSEQGAITVGVFQDFMGLAMSAVIAIVSGIAILDGEILLKEPHSERLFSSLLIATAGVILAWISLTPWLTLGGLTLVIFGGFISLGTRWEFNEEANIASRFICEKATAFLFSFFGACILGASRSALLLNDPKSWALNSDNITSSWIGSLFLILGFFFQMQPFPLLGRLVSNSKQSPTIRILLNQIFPAWAAVPLLIRLEPYFVSMGMFPAFGWVALCSVALTVVVGLFQHQWRLGLSIWLAAGFSLSIALLAFSGQLAAISMMLGVSFGCLALSKAASSLEVPSPKNVTFEKRANWLKAVAFLGAAAGTGMIGFVSATGGVRWLVQMWAFPGIVAFFVFNVFLFALLGWKLAWNIAKLQKVSNAKWLAVLSSYLWIILSLGIVWTGSITGDVGFGGGDRLAPSLLDRFFGEKLSQIPLAEDYISAASLYWGGLLAAMAVAFWTAGRKEDHWISLGRAFPVAGSFIANGYGVDTALDKTVLAINWLGRLAENIVDRQFWTNWLPKGLFYGVAEISKIANFADLKITHILEKTLKRLVEVPAKTLQMIQTGDLRWYLFFALSSGFGLLLHFLKM